MKLVCYLVFKASAQELRVVRRQPQLAWDEIAWKVELAIPMPWGRLVGAIKIDLPEAPPPTADVVLLPPPEA